MVEPRIPLLYLLAERHVVADLPGDLSHFDLEFASCCPLQLSGEFTLEAQRHGGLS